MKALCRAAMMLAMLAVAACTLPDETTVITGSVSYRGPVRLPANATLDVTLVEQSQAQTSVVAKQSMPAGDGVASLPFELRVDTVRLRQVGQRYVVRAIVRDASGTAWWATDRAYPVEPAPGQQNLGVLTLVSATQPAAAPPSAGTGSGVPSGVPRGAYVARGNEPGWMLSITGKTMTLQSDYGASKLEALVPAQQKIPGGYRYATRASGQALRIDVLNRVCRDDMSGNTFPDTVTVQAGNKTLRGCGGDPAFLLQRGRWLVWSINGQDMAANARPTLVFDAVGKVNGRACNSYSGTYQVAGEGLRFGPIVATKRACAPPLGDQENALLAVLRDAVRHELGADGSLTIETNDGRRLVARKG